MKYQSTALDGVVLIEPRVFEDSRGFFMETFHRGRFLEAGLPGDFAQDNHSRSYRGTLRGLHYQLEHAQGKLVRVVCGEIFDVAVDLRRWSPTFGHWAGFSLSDSNRRQLYLPPGMAHGFCTISETAEVSYKCTDFYCPKHERTLVWNDPAMAINWPIHSPLVSQKDQSGLPLAEVPCFEEQPAEWWTPLG